jgi:hypothetical protein
MKLAQKIERAFSSRTKPAQVRIADGVLQLDFEVEEALWFSGCDWHELTWQNWREHSSAIHFFDPEAFAYYLPGLLLLSARNSSEWLQAADSLINKLDCIPDPEGWTDGLKRRFLGLNPSELDVLKEWLLHICEYDSYKGWGNRSIRPRRHLWPSLRYARSS